jgi:enolase-phosphatase E1
LSAHVHALTASDTKAPYLKSLQGYLWARGYASGSLKCLLFPDVALCLHAWTAPASSSSSSHESPPLTLMIYSSGSIPAQKLLFSHTDSGDLTPLLIDYFDTTTAGPKTESASYTKILEKYPQWKADEWLFLSDNVNEVKAAIEAGMKAWVVVREGNAEIDWEGEGKGLSVVRSFEEVGVR